MAFKAGGLDEIIRGGREGRDGKGPKALRGQRGQEEEVEPGKASAKEPPLQEGTRRNSVPASAGFSSHENSSSSWTLSTGSAGKCLSISQTSALVLISQRRLPGAQHRPFPSCHITSSLPSWPFHISLLIQFCMGICITACLFTCIHNDYLLVTSLLATCLQAL